MLFLSVLIYGFDFPPNDKLKSYICSQVDQHNRVIVGGSAHTVAVGGYTLGGGHSPMSPMFGLAVDNLLEVELITTNGNDVTALPHSTITNYANGSSVTENDGDLFWALSGGGGGTFGIATTFTFKLHLPADEVVHFTCMWPLQTADGMEVGNLVLRKYFDMVPRLPREWGGYVLVNGISNTEYGFTGSVLLSLNHYGSYNTSSRKYMDEMKNFLTLYQFFCSYRNVSTFMEYEEDISDALYYPNYVAGGLINNSTLLDDDFLSYIMTELGTYPLSKSAITFTGTLLGGKVNDIDVTATSLHPGWRTAQLSLGLGLIWKEENNDYNDELADEGVKMGERVQRFVNGMYRNEASGNIDDFQNEFWGSHNYEKLLRIKSIWDPEKKFSCYDCIDKEEVSASVRLIAKSNAILVLIVMYLIKL